MYIFWSIFIPLVAEHRRTAQAFVTLYDALNSQPSWVMSVATANALDYAAYAVESARELLAGEEDV